MKLNDRIYHQNIREDISLNYLTAKCVLLCILLHCISGQETPGTLHRPWIEEDGSSLTHAPADRSHLTSQESPILSVKNEANWKLQRDRHLPWLLTRTTNHPSSGQASPPISVHRERGAAPGTRRRRDVVARYWRKESRTPFTFSHEDRMRRKKSRGTGPNRDNERSSGRIHIADDISYVSPSFDRNTEGRSSFRHYKDFQKDLIPIDVENKTLPLSLNSNQLELDKNFQTERFQDSASSNNFKFPEKIYKDGQVFYRHDAGSGTPESTSISSVTPLPDEEEYYLPTDSIGPHGESQMSRGFDFLMNHVRQQAQAGGPIISAAIAGASIRGSSEGSASHVIGSAINGGYFAASAQGYDGKGGAIHSHVHGTAESVSGGASAIAPNRDGEAFIQVDHSERGLSIGQSSTHNGEAFVVADVDSESKNTLQHGDSTSSYEHNYKTKGFGQSLGEAKSHISSINPTKHTRDTKQSDDSFDTEVSKHNQRAVGIEMIDSIMEMVHLPNGGVLPASKSKSTFDSGDNFRGSYPNEQRSYHNFTDISGKSPEGIKDEYFEEEAITAKTKKKGVVGVVTFPYDQEGLPPGPGELLDQTLHTNLHSPIGLDKEASVHSHFPYGSDNITDDGITKRIRDKNVLPLFSNDPLHGRGNIPSTKQFGDNSIDNFKEYRYPRVEERLSRGEQTRRNNDEAKDGQFHYVDAVQPSSVNESSFNNLNIPFYSPGSDNENSYYYHHNIHNVNRTDMLSPHERNEDFHYDNNFSSNGWYPDRNGTFDFKTNVDYHPYSNGDFDATFSLNNEQVGGFLFNPQSVPQINTSSLLEPNLLHKSSEQDPQNKFSHEWEKNSDANQQSYLQPNTEHRNQFDEDVYVQSASQQVTKDPSHSFPGTRTFVRKFPFEDYRNETEIPETLNFPYGVDQPPDTGNQNLPGHSFHVDINQTTEDKVNGTFHTDHHPLPGNYFPSRPTQLPGHEIPHASVPRNQTSLPDDTTTGDRTNHNISPSYWSFNNIPFNSSTSNPINDTNLFKEEVISNQTHLVTDNKTSEVVHHFGRNETEKKFSPRSDIPIYSSVPTDEDKQIRTIPAGKVGSTQLLKPVHPGQPFINVVTRDRNAQRLPQHRSGIMIGPGEKLPGIPGYRIPPGFRAKVIIGDIVPNEQNSNSRRGNQRRISHQNLQQKSSLGRSYSNNNYRKKQHQFTNYPRNFQTSRHASNKVYNQKSQNSNSLANLCNYLSYSCETRGGSNRKDQLCNPFIVGVACCC